MSVPPSDPLIPDTVVAGRISVIVPTKDSARTLAACLASVRAQTHPDVELVVVDNSSTDATPEIARSVADRFLTFGPERSAQRNHGAANSTGELLLFVDSDLSLESGVCEDAATAAAANPSWGSLIVPELAHGEGFLARCRGLEKRLYLDNPSVEGSRVYRREAFFEVGGFDERLTGYEDWDLGDRVAHSGWDTGRTIARAWHDEGRIRLPHAFAKKRYYGRWFDRYVSESGGPHRPVRRSGLLARRRLLVESPVLTTGLVLLKTVEWTGMAVGAFEGRRRPPP